MRLSLYMYLCFVCHSCLLNACVCCSTRYAQFRCVSVRGAVLVVVRLAKVGLPPPRIAERRRAAKEGPARPSAGLGWARLPQASYPCGNLSDTSSWTFLRPKGSIGHVFTACKHSYWAFPLWVHMIFLVTVGRGEPHRFARPRLRSWSLGRPAGCIIMFTTTNSNNARVLSIRIPNIIQGFPV